jgi:DNA-binding beta-propeller fold protein YncE
MNYKIRLTLVSLFIFITLIYIWIPSTKEAGYIFVTAWGTQGKKPGQFRDPIGIAVSDSEVFVSDSRNARIQVFDYFGNFKRIFSLKLGRPMNLVIHNNELYVADYWNDNIHVFNLNGKSLRKIGNAGTGKGEFNGISGVAVNEKGEIFAADFYNQRIQHLRADGSFIKQWGNTKKKGMWAGEMNYPTDVAVTKDDILYVADSYNDRIQVFSSDSFLRKWGGPFALNISGFFNGWFATVTSVAIGPKGNIFTTDFYNNRVQKFTANGSFLSAFGEKGNGAGQFDRAVAVATAPNGAVFVVDLGNNRIQKWQPL